MRQTLLISYRVRKIDARSYPPSFMDEVIEVALEPIFEVKDRAF